MKTSSDLSGQIFGRWTVLNDSITTPKGERKWLCRCACGTERYVLERSLRSGGSLSCGCLRKDSAREANAYDLTGRVFGDLTVLGPSRERRSYGGQWWHCRCDCGTERDFPATLLTTGKQTNCGGPAHAKNYAYRDITGKRFGMLTALYPTDRRTDKGYVIWHCRCDCGRELGVSYNDLRYSATSSCGCLKREHEQNLRRYLTNVGHTSLDQIRSNKLPANNTTGARGVYLVKGKYLAKLVFQKKAYYLGNYDTIAEAVEARKEAEDALFRSTLDYYERWQQRAQEDPDWAEANPVRISVTRSGGRFRVSFYPVLD